jgi:DNA-binding MarR family transcriptional regulator
MSDEGGTRIASGEAAPAMLDAAAEALFRLGRLFSRRSLAATFAGRNGRAPDLSRVLVAQALVEGNDADRNENTVGLVAERLGVEPSTASRLVADAVRDGYVVRASSSLDSRRVRLALTADGAALTEAARRYQRRVFDEVTQGWPEIEREEFARLFLRFAAAVEQRIAPKTPAR